MEYNTMPKELLNDVAWSFAQKRFGSLPEFAEALAEYNAEIFEKPFTDVWTNKLQLVGNRILIQYEYWNDEEEDIIEQIMLQADNNKYFTTAELLYKVHNEVRDKLEGDDHIFFEGLGLFDNESEEYPGVPYYFIFQGS